MFCPECGAPNEEEAVYCGNCGAILRPDAVPNEAALDAPGEEEKELYEQVVPDQDLSAPELPQSPPPPRPVAPPPRPATPPRQPAPAGSSLPTSGMAVAALVLGIGGLTLLPLLGSILAVVFGYMARNDIRQRPGQVTGEGLATAGIILGWIAIGLAVVGLLLGGAFTICGFCGAMSSSG